MTEIVCRPLTAKRWPDLEKLFGANGACSGCWCMWFRLSQREFDARKYEPNRHAFRELCMAGRPLGVIAYEGRKPVGWCAVAPRCDYPRLAGSRLFKPIDDRPAWSVTCFFVARDARRGGITAALLEGAVNYARRKGARVIEGYPIDPGKKKDVMSMAAFHGLVSVFEEGGFATVAKPSAGRRYVRLELN